MRQKSGFLQKLLLFLNFFIILVLLISSILLLYLSIHKSSTVSIGNYELYLADNMAQKDGGKNSLIVLDRDKTPDQNQTILYQEQIGQEKTVAYIATIKQVNESVITLDNNMTVTKSQILGQVKFDSPVLGSLISFLSNPQYSTFISIGLLCLFVIFAGIILLSLTISSRKKASVPAKSSPSSPVYRMEDLLEVEKDVVFESHPVHKSPHLL